MKARAHRQTTSHATLQNDDIHVNSRNTELTKNDKKTLTNIKKDKKRRINKGETIGAFTYVAIQDLREEIKGEILKKYGKYSRDGLVPVLIPSSNVHIDSSKLIKACLAPISDLDVAIKIKTILEKCSLLHEEIGKVLAQIKNVADFYDDLQQHIELVQQATNECGKLCLELREGMSPISKQHLEEKLDDISIKYKKLASVKKEGIEKGLAVMPSYNYLVPGLSEIMNALEQISEPKGSNDIRSWNEAWKYYHTVKDLINESLPNFHQQISKKQEHVAALFEVCKKEAVEIDEIGSDIVDNFPANSKNEGSIPTASIKEIITSPRTIPQQYSQASYASAQHSTQFKSVSSTNSQQTIYPASHGQRISPPSSPTKS